MAGMGAIGGSSGGVGGLSSVATFASVQTAFLPPEPSVTQAPPKVGNASIPTGYESNVRNPPSSAGAPDPRRLYPQVPAPAPPAAMTSSAQVAQEYAKWSKLV